MIQLFFTFLALVFLGAIIKNTGVKRLNWFLIGIIFIPNTVIIVTSPFLLGFQNFLIYGFLFSVLIRHRSLFREYKGFPIKYIFLFLLIAHFLVGFFDPRLSLIYKLYKPSLNFITTFLVILLAYKSIQKEEDWKSIFNTFFISSIIMGLYGIFVFITESNPYDALISSEYNAISYFQEYIYSMRFRVNSVINHPITYGYFCAIIFIYLLIFHSQLSIIKKNFNIIALSLLFINLIFTNSRTPLITFFAGIMVYGLITLNLTSKIRMVFIGVFVSFMLYSNVPIIQERIDLAVDVFITGGADSDGSSVDMRQTQLIASLYYFYQKPIFGNGFEYITENLGWDSDKDKRSSEDDFAGFESYGYKLLIEQGIVMIVFVSIFFFTLIRYFYRHRMYTPHYSGIGQVSTIMFLVFSLATGTLGTWTISFVLIGVAMKLIELNKTNGQEISHRNTSL